MQWVKYFFMIKFKQIITLNVNCLTRLKKKLGRVWLKRENYGWVFVNWVRGNDKLSG